MVSRMHKQGFRVQLNLEKSSSTAIRNSVHTFSPSPWKPTPVSYYTLTQSIAYYSRVVTYYIGDVLRTWEEQVRSSYAVSAVNICDLWISWPLTQTCDPADQTVQCYHSVVGNHSTEGCDRRLQWSGYVVRSLDPSRVRACWASKLTLSIRASDRTIVVQPRRRLRLQCNETLRQRQHCPGPPALPPVVRCYARPTV
jgi:hypothetical protein